ncbi:MAG: hypothetical protein MJ237_06095 [bacterium]|nr:hypothetical protein [bacterium]
MGLIIFFETRKKNADMVRFENARKELRKLYKKDEMTEEDDMRADSLEEFINSVYTTYSVFSKYSFLMNFFGFADNCENGEYMEIAKCQIEDFIDAAKEVLANHDLAPTKLPLCTEMSPCWGSAEYDDYYFGDIEFAMEQLDIACHSVDWDNEILYMSANW